MKYIFIHIGKTAGTSFRTFLESNVKRPYWGYETLHFLAHENLDIRDPGKFIEAEPNGHRIFEYLWRERALIYKCLRRSGLLTC